MKKSIITLAMFTICLCGCGSGEPSLSEIEDGFRMSFASQTGMPASSMHVKAKRLEKGRWAVRMTATRYDGQSRSLDATAVMDENGDIHYYTD